MRKLAAAVGAALALAIPARGAWALQVGDAAPPFAASSDRGEVRLADHLGRRSVILAFYFAVNTSA